jgi:hypothetical protein
MRGVAPDHEKTGSGKAQRSPFQDAVQQGNLIRRLGKPLHEGDEEFGSLERGGFLSRVGARLELVERDGFCHLTAQGLDSGGEPGRPLLENSQNVGFRPLSIEGSHDFPPDASGFERVDNGHQAAGIIAEGSVRTIQS